MNPLLSSGTIPTGPEDGPEEGEIVSDDLEDISDESIIFTPYIGKSLSRSDHLNALSLSSITDLEDIPLEKPRKRKKSYCPRHAKRRKSRRKLVDSDSSDDDTTLDRRLKLQLKAAVRVDVGEAHRNSLRTRLRAMVNSTSGPESDNGTIEQKRVKDKETEPNNMIITTDKVVDLPPKEITVIEIDSGTDSVATIPEVILNPSVMNMTSTETVLSVPETLESDSEQLKDDNDSELMQLRIEALKTAINNKFANRKRRRKENKDSTISDDTNKENTNANNGKTQEKKTDIRVEIPQISPQSSNEPDNDTPPSPEEDEDVLRALLLASISKKITSHEPDITATVPIKPMVTHFGKVAPNQKLSNVNNFKLNNLKSVVNSMKNFVNKASGNTKLFKMPQVKPLIISVNSDSDSDFDLSSSPEKSPKKLQQNAEKDSTLKPAINLDAVIESSVDKFLREQRAKVEFEVQTIQKASLETLKNVIDIKKNIVTQGKVQVNSEVTLGPTKNRLLAKSLAIKITPGTNKPVINTNKKVQILNLAPDNPKDLKLAELEKSALKFLPENKREEYKQLQNLLMLRKAQLRKPRVRRASQKVSESNNPRKVVNNNGDNTKNNSQFKNKIVPDKRTVVSKKASTVVSVVPKEKQNTAKPVNKTVVNEKTQTTESTNQLSKIEARSQERRSQQLKAEARNQERKSDALLLHTTLKQMQTRKDGRLQIQERYKSLRPLIKKINDISKEQKHWDHEVKKLLEQLAEARKNQQDVHQNMSSFVKELAGKKQKMDESPAKSSVKPKIANLITSTPFKKNVPETSLDISAVDGAVPFRSPILNGTNQLATISTEEILVDKRDESERTQKNESMVNNTWEQCTQVDINVNVKISDAKRVVSDTELNVVDPNDIDKIIRKTEEKVAVLEKKGSLGCKKSERVRYVSPLDSVKSSAQNGRTDLCKSIWSDGPVTTIPKLVFTIGVVAAVVMTFR